MSNLEWMAHFCSRQNNKCINSVQLFESDVRKGPDLPRAKRQPHRARLCVPVGDVCVCLAAWFWRGLIHTAVQHQTREDSKVSFWRTESKQKPSGRMRHADWAGDREESCESANNPDHVAKQADLRSKLLSHTNARMLCRIKTKCRFFRSLKELSLSLSQRYPTESSRRLSALFVAALSNTANGFRGRTWER